MGETSETAQFDNLAFPRIICSDALEGLVQVQHAARRLRSDNYGIVQRDSGRPTTAFLSFARPRIVHQNLTQDTCRNCEKMNSILTGYVHFNQPHVGLVNESSGCKRVVGTFGPEDRLLDRPAR